MNKKIILALAILTYVVAGCNHKKTSDFDTHSHDGSSHGAHEGHDDHGHDHEDAKFQYTSYTKDFEVFAEADPFVAGEKANVLAHFSHLPSFKALEKGKITLELYAGNSVTKVSLDKPTRTGIYSFNITPKSAGIGDMVFKIETTEGLKMISVSDIRVYSDAHNAEHAAADVVINTTNANKFTKEQSWRIDFATDFPVKERYQEIVKATGKIESGYDKDILLTAKISGKIKLRGNKLYIGNEISNGQEIFQIIPEGADNNFAVKYAEIENNYLSAKSNYDRDVKLSGKKIISEKHLLESELAYKNAKAEYDNFKRNSSKGKQVENGRINGVIKEIFVKNGQYVEAGQAILSFANSDQLVITAEVPNKYASVISNANELSIKSAYSKKVYQSEELNAVRISNTSLVNTDNYLIPVRFSINNVDNFIIGSLLDTYITFTSQDEHLTIPNNALIEEEGNFFVYVQINPELFEKRLIELGATDGVKSEVLAGITSNERIVTQGAIFIKLAQAIGSVDAHSGHVH